MTREGIVCAGVSCLDLFLYGAEPLATRESLSLVARTEYRPGGATSNTGRALARLGAPVEFMTVIGDDANGDILCRLWEADGVNCRYVVRLPGVGTSLSTLPVYQDGKRGVYFCSGANAVMDGGNLFGPEQAYLPVLRERAAFHFGYPPLTPRLQGEALAQMLAAVRETGVLVSLDTTPVADDETLGRMLGASLPLIHLFAPNIEEASQVTGHFSRLAQRAAAVSAETSQPVDFEDVVTADELMEIGDRLLEMGVPLVVITLGKQGAFICTGSAAAVCGVPHAAGIDASWADLRAVVPAFRVDGPLNTTGAGDTFVAALLVGLTGGMTSFVEIVRLAQAAGALHIDQSRGLRSAAEVHAAMTGLPVREPSNPQLQRLLSTLC